MQKRVVLWPGGDEPIAPGESVEVRAGLMALEALRQGASKVWCVPRPYWDHSPSEFTKAEIKRILEYPQPMAFIDTDGTVNVRAVGEGPNINEEFARRFEQAR